MLAARKINDEFNFLDGIHTNVMFITVWFIIVFGQVAIVQFGKSAMKVHTAGLTSQQWVICLIVAFTSLIWNAVLKCVPDKFCPVMGDETEEEIKEAQQDYANLRNIASVNKQTIA